MRALRKNPQNRTSHHTAKWLHNKKKVMIGQKWFWAPVYVEGGWVGNGAHQGACEVVTSSLRSMQPWIRNTPPSYHLHFDLRANYQQPDFGHISESYLSTRNICCLILVFQCKPFIFLLSLSGINCNTLLEDRCWSGDLQCAVDLFVGCHWQQSVTYGLTQTLFDQKYHSNVNER